MSAQAGPIRFSRSSASWLWIRDARFQALVILTAVAALLRFLTLGTQSYWYDEAITVELVQRPFHAMLGAVPTSESTPPLYYVLAWIWSRMLGTGETGLRSLSAVLGTLTVPATYAGAQALVSRRSALFAAALVAVSPFLVWYSQEARAYALLVLLGALSLVPLRRVMRPRAGRALAARRGPGAHDALLRIVPRRRGGPLAAASRVGEACSGNGGGRCCRRRCGASAPCCLPGAVLPTHCLDLELRRGRKPS